MRGGYDTSINAENDFILDSHILVNLENNWKTMNSKTDSNHKEWTPGDTKKYGEQIAALNGSLNDYIHPFHGTARNMARDAEISRNITHGLLLSARKYGTE